MGPAAERSSPEGPADDGLQRERTVLAWRRTGLALFVAAVVLGRLTAQTTGPVATVLSVAGAATALWAVFSTLRRRRLAAPSPTESAFDSILRDGKLPAALTGTAALLCVLELAAVLGR